MTLFRFRYRVTPIQRTALAIFVLLITSWAGGGPAAANEQPGSAALTLLSASEIDYPPFCLLDTMGKPTGFSVELMQAAMAAMGRTVHFRVGPWTDVRSWLENGDIQALPLVGRNPERENFFDFTFPYMSLHGAIVVRNDTEKIRTLEDLRGRTVAVMAGDNAEEFLRRKDRGIDIVARPTFEIALQELSEGHHDAVVVQRLVALRLIQESGMLNLRLVNQPVEGFRQDFCFAVREGNRQTLALLNEGLALVIADGTYRRLHAKWFAALQLPSDRPIIVGGDHYYPPYEYLDESGRPAGFAVDMTRAIAREMNMNIQIRLGPWADMVRGLENREFDALQGIYYSKKRDAVFDFSPPYLMAHFVSVVRRGNGDPPITLEALAMRDLVVQDGDIIHDFLVSKGLEDRLTLVTTQEEALKGISEGRYDCAVLPRLSTLDMIEKNRWSNLVLGGQALFSGEYAFAVPNGHAALLAQFTEGLKVLEESGEYRKIYEKWLGVYPETSPTLDKILYYFAMVIVPLFLAFIGFFLWSWFLRKQVASRTESLRASEEFQRVMLACSPVALYSIDFKGNVMAWNASAERMFGWTADEIIGRPLPIVPDDRQGEFEIFRERTIKDGGVSNVHVVRQRKDGQRFDASLSVAPIRDARSRIIGIMESVEDITERLRFEDALRQSESKYRLLVENQTDMVIKVDPDGRFLFVSPSYCRTFGKSEEELIGQTFMPLVHEQDREAMIRALASLEQPPHCAYIEHRVLIKDRWSWLAWMDTAVLDSRGKICEIIGVGRDITAQKRAEAEHEKLQGQLIQARKIESVGRLAGGVAHDYNNMLGVIIGYAELIMEKMAPDDPLQDDLREILKAARRSADITRQLLAFARKQTIAPRIIDLNDTVEGMLKMLRRLIGEDIDLDWRPACPLGFVNMDPSQIDQILANLCVNARDAIGGVGKLSIETSHAHFDEEFCAVHQGFTPGDYVMLAVSDNGCGMDRHALDNLFEPYYTTKDVGKGTGLGLATVYGIVKQNGGFIQVESEPLNGATFKIYLPRHAGEENRRALNETLEIPGGKGETLLIVEDETSILKLAQTILTRLGYKVLAAASPVQALALAEAHAGEIDLLITDVVMPEMNGRSLADHLHTLYPELHILFMSGYTADVIAHRGVLDTGLNFVQKPFTQQELAVKVREALK